MVLQLLDNRFFIRKRFVEHDEVVELLDEVVAVRGNEHLQACAYEARQQARQLYLVGSVEMTFRFVDDEEIPLFRHMLQEKVEIRQSTSRGGGEMQGSDGMRNSSFPRVK